MMIDYDDDTVTYLFSFAFNHGVSTIASYQLSPDTPSFSVPDKRKMVINMNIRNKKELPFQIAHELGHIFNHDHGKEFYYLKNVDTPVEVDASKTAICLLASYYFDELPTSTWNIDKFFNYYCIPTTYKDWFTNNKSVCASK